MIQTKFQNCIEACQQCVVMCNQCTVACLNEKDVEHLKKCIQLNLECAAICSAAVNVLSLDGKFSKELCRLCIDICNACADECEKHVAMGMEHCKQCADACRECAKACKEMLATA
ncbi:four-helix bundle copper-binding protein [Sphingobacterium siyangense]|uniref:four-helix bundle copper-binding protein n=2 Tax=Sphingobacteriaceae TaxID=84566 RepID=UPI000B48F70A|nr:MULTISPECIES: four-helix bundle copper-binding protein [unclassified Sphingobacterium]MBB1647411.1 four-helix bundle copper-binding protein [Sphingobacterium sp. UME9]MDV3619286.1 four-helix bundle copper-binding protein [Elizabethkingia anophelis]